MNKVQEQSTSASDLLITFTIFDDVQAREKRECADMPWSELVARIRSPQTVYIDKAHCPLIKLAEFGDKPSDKGSLRYDGNMRRVFGCEFDYDEEKMPLAIAAQKLTDANIRAVLYTSPSNKPDRPRWRALFPFSEPATTDKRAIYLARANRILDGTASDESFTLSQSFYIGRVGDSVYETAETLGRCIDQAADIEPQYLRASANGEAPRDETTDEELRATFKTGEGRYNAMLKLSSRWAMRGASYGDIVANFQKLFDGAGLSSLNPDGIDLRERIQGMAATAIRKYGESRDPNRADDALEAMREREAIQQESKPRYVARAVQWREWISKPIVPRQWWIQDWLTPAPTLCAGKGGSGKSTLWQTIGTALACGIEFIGVTIKPLRVLIWACEDDENEVVRRQAAINAYFNIGFDALDILTIEPRQGCDNTLLHTQFGKPTPTLEYQRLGEQVNDQGVDVLILDNTAQTFGGNENDRHQVTTHINSIAGLVHGRPFLPVFLGHPGRGNGSEFSGSSAWENAVRTRLYQGSKLPDASDDDEDADADDNVIYLSKRKVNYSAKDWRKFNFQRDENAGAGLWVPERRTVEAARTYTTSQQIEVADDVVMSGFLKLRAMGIQAVDGKNSPDYLPRQLREKKLHGGQTLRDLTAAMNRLMASGRFKRGVIGQYPNRTDRLGLTLAGENSEGTA